MELFNIGFVTIRLVDIVDISIVTFLFFKLYELLKGSLAIRILTGVLLIFLFWKLVDLLDMVLLKSILDQFLGVGAIALIIIFASEIRRFLLIISRNTVFDRIWQQITSSESNVATHEIADAVETLRDDGVGALIILAGEDKLERIQETGDIIGAQVSDRLFSSIFQPLSPLHDGAVIVSDGIILAARCVLPLTERTDLPPELGLRHRSAIGISEQSDSLSIIVSEERKEVSLAFRGELERNIDIITLNTRIRQHYKLES